MPHMTHPDPGTVYACRSCNKTAVYERTGRGNAHKGDPDARCRCGECGATFEAPIIREPECDDPPTGCGGRKSKLEKLIDAGEVDI